VIEYTDTKKREFENRAYKFFIPSSLKVRPTVGGRLPPPTLVPLPCGGRRSVTLNAFVSRPGFCESTMRDQIPNIHRSKVDLNGNRSSLQAVLNRIGTYLNPDQKMPEECTFIRSGVIKLAFLE